MMMQISWKLKMKDCSAQPPPDLPPLVDRVLLRLAFAYSDLNVSDVPGGQKRTTHGRKPTAFIPKSGVAALKRAGCLCR